jgi:hypothetical protein
MKPKTLFYFQIIISLWMISLFIFLIKFCLISAEIEMNGNIFLKINVAIFGVKLLKLKLS